MAGEGSSPKRDIFNSALFRGLSSTEHVRLLAEALRFLPPHESKPCVETGCSNFAGQGLRCDAHRKAKAAEASRIHYARYGKKKGNDPE